jgi:hypothetical protein
MAEPVDAYLPRKLSSIRRTPELVEPEHVVPIHQLDAMFAEMAIDRMDEIDQFSDLELDFFARGEAEAASWQHDGFEDLA